MSNKAEEAQVKAKIFRLYKICRRDDCKCGDCEDMQAAIRAAYEAGEIAMREKAAEQAERYTANRLASMIRALALSGAEESKK